MAAAFKEFFGKIQAIEGAAPRTATYVALFAIAIAASIFYLWKSHFHLEISGDTPSYLYYGPERPLGYPIFLSIVRAFSRSLEALPAIQFIILGMSVGVLGLSLRVVAGVLPALIFLAITASNSTYWESANSVQSDALSMAVTNVFCAVVLLNVMIKRAGLKVAYVIVTVLAIAIRPVNLALLPASILAITFLDGAAPLPAMRRSYRSLVALVLGALLAWHSAQIGELIRGEPVVSASPFARGLLTKTLFFQSPPHARQISTSVDDRLIEAAVKPVNAYLAAAPTDFADYFRINYYENALRFNYIIPALSRAHGFEHAYQLDGRLGDYSVAKIKRAPADFVSGVVREYWYFVSYKGYHSAAFRRSARAFISRHPLVIPPSVPPLDEELAQQTRARADLGLPRSAIPGVSSQAIMQVAGKSTFAVLVMRLYHGVAALLGLAAAVMLFTSRTPRRLRPFLAAITVLAVVVHGEAFITAVSEAGMRRYVVPLWTVMSAGYCFAAAVGLARFIAPVGSISNGEGLRDRRRAGGI